MLVSGCSESYERYDSAGEVRYINYSYALKMMITADEGETTVNNLANG